MAEHFTKTTTEASFRCAKCNRNTMHQVFDGRRGSCLDCIKRLEAAAAAAAAVPAPAKQETLF